MKVSSARHALNPSTPPGLLYNTIYNYARSAILQQTKHDAYTTKRNADDETRPRRKPKPKMRQRPRTAINERRTTNEMDAIDMRIATGRTDAMRDVVQTLRSRKWEAGSQTFDKPKAVFTLTLEAATGRRRKPTRRAPVLDLSKPTGGEGEWWWYKKVMRGRERSLKRRSRKR